MSRIEVVRVTEQSVKNALEALNKADKQDQNLQDRLIAELRNATDDYANAVRELNVRSPR
jgi:hypothetical protein